jgi:predicted ester cyclase
MDTMKHFMQPNLKAGSLFLLMVLFSIPGCQKPPDPSKISKPLVDKYVEVWNGADPKILDSILDPHFVRHVNLTPDVEGVDGMKRVISGFRTAYPDLKIALNDEIYSENKSVGRWTLMGTNTGAGEMPPTGKSVMVWGLSVLHYANGKIKEEWVGFDNQALMGQLGYTMTPQSESRQKGN